MREMEIEDLKDREEEYDYIAEMGRRFRKNTNNPNKHIPDMKKPFNKTALGRTIAGRNKTGRIIHSVLDVLPIPNIHEVTKAVIKEEEQRNEVLSTWELFKQTFVKLDWLRTIVGVIAALLLVKGSEWVGVDIDTILAIAQQLIGG